MFTHTNRHRARACALALMMLGLVSLLRPQGAEAQNRAAEAYQRAYEMVLDEEWDSASDALRAFLRQHPRSDWVDDVQFWQCYVQEKSGGSDERAFDCYQQFAEDNAGSKWTDDAHTNMVNLAQRLARSGKREYMEVVRAMQAESDEAVKISALDALWQMGDERALDAVLDLYDGSGSITFRKKIVFALSQFGTPRAAEKLKDIALQDDNPGIRKEAIFWISQRGDADVIPLLEEIARQENSPEVQKSIVFALSQLGRDGVPQLIAMARTNDDPEIRKEAIFWLSQIGGDEVMAFYDTLINESNDEEVQKGLVFAISQLGREGAPRLMTIARTHRNPEVRKDAIFWLSQIGGADVMDFFGEMIDASDDEEVQKGLVFAISQMGRAGVPHLMDIARTHGNAKIREDAIFWLSQTGGSGVIDFFDELMDGEADYEVQKQITFALSQLGGEGVPVLIDIAKTHPNARIRKDAIFWLGQTDDPRAREALLDIVRGQD